VKDVFTIDRSNSAWRLRGAFLVLAALLLAMLAVSSTARAEEPEVEPVCGEPGVHRAQCFSLEVEAEPSFEGSGKSGGFSPQDLQSAYSISPIGGSGRTIAIVDAYDNPNAEADL
jgi:hypothetical protein